MPRIKPMSWKDLERVILAFGYVLVRQTASHRIYWKEGVTRPLVVNDHGKKDIEPFVILGLLRTAGISREEFLAMVEKI